MNPRWLGIEVPACPQGPTWCYLLSAGAQSVGRKAASGGNSLVPMPAAVEYTQAVTTARSLIPGTQDSCLLIQTEAVNPSEGSGRGSWEGASPALLRLLPELSLECRQRCAAGM